MSAMVIILFDGDTGARIICLSFLRALFMLYN
jgi:hypothetical protein